ncbi:MAG: hypothetical protein KF773_21285 [Deltaproteobacteria bacterium]|nr:hypothetical protein [Deltaproteobacteria bacterium]
MITIVAGCAGGHHREPVVANSKAPDGKGLVEEADRLEEAWWFDVREPFAGVDDRAVRVRALRARACRDGHRPSCWRAGRLEEVRANCAAGHLLSCRAIPRHERPEQQTQDDLPGRFGRSILCRAGVDCEEHLWAECRAGFPWSCSNLYYLRHGLSVGNNPDEPARDAAMERAIALGRDGCAAGIVHECELARFSDRLAERQAVERTMCRLGDLCSPHAWIEDGRTIEARDLLERACQERRDDFACSVLAKHYLKGRFPEPEPGRGRRLLEWACRRRHGDSAFYEDCLERAYW